MEMVFGLHPTEQGLKHNVFGWDYDTLICFRPASNRTRIETNPISKYQLQDVFVFGLHPTEQGLKLTKYDKIKESVNCFRPASNRTRIETIRCHLDIIGAQPKFSACIQQNKD